MIFDMYLKDGIGAKAIATRLNALQIQPQKSEKWEAGQHSQNSEKSSLCRKNTVAYEKGGRHYI